MKTEYLPSLIKDLKALKSTANFGQIKQVVFESVPNIDSLEQIPGLKRLKGNKKA